MTTIEAEFDRELEIFRAECETPARFLYGYLAIHEIASRNQRIFRLLNENALFWNTVLGALQQGAFIALGRIFDQKSQHNIDKLLKLAQSNRSMFSRSALARRKQGSETNPPSWLGEYMRDIREPRVGEFRKLRAEVKKHRAIYEASYRDIRNKVFAHKAISHESEVHALFAKTNATELQRLVVFLLKVYSALWQLFMNGRPLVLRPLRYSTKRMAHSPEPPSSSLGVQERIVREAARVLREAARPNKLHLSAASRRRS